MDYIPAQTMNYLKFIDDPQMNDLVKTFNAHQVKDQFKNKLKGPHVFKSRIREKTWQPISNRFEVLANTNEGSIYTIAEETVDKSYTVKASEFDIDIRKVTVDLEKFSPFFNECRKKQDIMKQNMLKDV